MIYVHISMVVLGFSLFELLIVDVHISTQMLRESREIGAKPSQES